MAGAAHDFINRQGDPGIWHIENCIHAVNIQPAAHDRSPNIRLVLMIRGYHFDFDSWPNGAEILEGHLRSEY